MKYLLIFITALSFGCATTQNINADGEKVMVRTDDSRIEQYAIKRGAEFYWIRYGRLVPIDKPVLSFRRL